MSVHTLVPCHPAGLPSFVEYFSSPHKSFTDKEKRIRKGVLPDFVETITGPQPSPAVVREKDKRFTTPKSTPEIKRVPVTQEYMAVVVAGKYSGGLEVEKLFTDVLYDSVAGLVYSLAKKYACTCRDEIADLVNDCALRIFDKIKQFDPMKGKFTTWCWRVCSSVLNRKYRSDRKHTDRLSEYEGMEEILADDPPSAISEDMREVVLGLFDEYPEKREVLKAMFGDPGGGLFMPDRICPTKIARELDMEYSHVYSFFHRKVKPVFVERFRGRGR